MWISWKNLNGDNKQTGKRSVVEGNKILFSQRRKYPSLRNGLEPPHFPRVLQQVSNDVNQSINQSLLSLSVPGSSLLLSSMATLQAHLSAISAIGSCCSSSTTTTSLVSVGRWPQSRRKIPGDRWRTLQRSVVRAMVQQAVPGAPAAYAKEMERLSAKESLLLAVSLNLFVSYTIR